VKKKEEERRYERGIHFSSSIFHWSFVIAGDTPRSIYLPLVICHWPFSIAEQAARPMENGKWKMENDSINDQWKMIDGKWKMKRPTNFCSST
jgi:hypothetical protein